MRRPSRRPRLAARRYSGCSRTCAADRHSPASPSQPSRGPSCSSTASRSDAQARPPLREGRPRLPSSSPPPPRRRPSAAPRAAPSRGAPHAAERRKHPKIGTPMGSSACNRLSGGDRAASVAPPHVVHGSRRSCSSESFWLCFVRPITKPVPQPPSMARPRRPCSAGRLRCLSWLSMATHSMRWRMVR